MSRVVRPRRGRRPAPSTVPDEPAPPIGGVRTSDGVGTAGAAGLAGSSSSDVPPQNVKCAFRMRAPRRPTADDRGCGDVDHDSARRCAPGTRGPGATRRRRYWECGRFFPSSSSHHSSDFGSPEGSSHQRSSGPRRLATIAASGGDDHGDHAHADGRGDRPEADDAPGQDEQGDADAHHHEVAMPPPRVHTSQGRSGHAEGPHPGVQPVGCGPSAVACRCRVPSDGDRDLRQSALLGDDRAVGAGARDERPYRSRCPRPRRSGTGPSRRSGPPRVNSPVESSRRT